MVVDDTNGLVSELVATVVFTFVFCKMTQHFLVHYQASGSGHQRCNTNQVGGVHSKHVQNRIDMRGIGAVQVHSSEVAGTPSGATVQSIMEQEKV
jgi:hypothetical protein